MHQRHVREGRDTAAPGHDERDQACLGDRVHDTEGEDGGILFSFSSPHATDGRTAIFYCHSFAVSFVDALLRIALSTSSRS